MDSIVIGEKPLTGPVNIDINKVVEKWNHLWSIAEWRSGKTFTLVKLHRWDSPNYNIRLTISEEDANEIIRRVGLVTVNINMFQSAFNYQREEDIKYIHEKRLERLDKKFGKRERKK